MAPRPTSTADFCRLIAAQSELTEAERMLGCELAQGVERVDGHRFDFQPSSQAPRPSFGVGLAGVGGSLLSFGYRASEVKPDVTILPRTDSGSVLPPAAREAFEHALDRRHFVYGANERIPLSDLDVRDIDTLVAAVREAAEAVGTRG